MKKEFDRKLIFEDGQEYYGYGFGADAEAVCEIVFNTSMVGYQEILSDPSYADQAVVMTYPLIGNYGMAKDDYERDTPSIGALIVHAYYDEPSNFRSTATLSEVMLKFGIPGISGIDTRKLNRSIRDFGTRKALITGSSTPLKDGLARLKCTTLPRNAVSRVSCKQKIVSAASFPQYHVVAIDCGMKQNMPSQRFFVSDAASNRLPLQVQSIAFSFRRCAILCRKSAKSRSIHGIFPCCATPRKWGFPIKSSDICGISPNPTCFPCAEATVSFRSIK